METLTLFVKGLIVGIIVAAPMGPVNIICIHRTIIRGRIDGFMTGMGGVIGDAVFAIIAALGLTAASVFVEENEFWFRLPGGLMLLVIAGLVWRRHPHIGADDTSSTGLVRSIAATFLLTISNPITVAAFAFLFVSYGLTTGFDYVAAATVVGGVIAGSALWWLVLVSTVGLLHGHIEDRHLETFNRIAAVAVFLFGIYAIDSVTANILS